MIDVAKGVKRTTLRVRDIVERHLDEFTSVVGRKLA